MSISNFAYRTFVLIDFAWNVKFLLFKGKKLLTFFVNHFIVIIHLYIFSINVSNVVSFLSQNVISLRISCFFFPEIYLLKIKNGNSMMALINLLISPATNRLRYQTSLNFSWLAGAHKVCSISSWKMQISSYRVWKVTSIMFIKKFHFFTSHKYECNMWLYEYNKLNGKTEPTKHVGLFTDHMFHCSIQLALLKCNRTRKNQEDL